MVKTKLLCAFVLLITGANISAQQDTISLQYVVNRTSVSLNLTCIINDTSNCYLNSILAVTHINGAESNDLIYCTNRNISIYTMQLHVCILNNSKRIKLHIAENGNLDCYLNGDHSKVKRLYYHNTKNNIVVTDLATSTQANSRLTITLVDFNCTQPLSNLNLLVPRVKSLMEGLFEFDSAASIATGIAIILAIIILCLSITIIVIICCLCIYKRMKKRASIKPLLDECKRTELSSSTITATRSDYYSYDSLLTMNT